MPNYDDASGDLVDRPVRSSESRYRRAFENAGEGILFLDADTARIEDVNPRAVEMLGYPRAALLGKKLWEAGPFRDFAESRGIFAELRTKGRVRHENIPLKTKANEQIEVEFVGSAYDCDGVKVIQCDIREITARKAIEAKHRRLLNFYAALSRCNKAIVRCGNEQELYSQICHAAVQFGGMKLAWVGVIDAKTRLVRPVACSGDDAAFLRNIRISTDADSRFGLGPTSSAIRENHPCWMQDLQNDPAAAPWRELAARHHVASSGALPLRKDGAVIGIFTLYSDVVSAFDELERGLLAEMAADISFALDNFAREAARRKAEEALREGEERYRRMFEANPLPMWVYDEETLAFLAVNDAAVAHYGWSREEFLTMTLADIRPPDAVSDLLKHLATDVDKSIRVVPKSRHRKKDGMLIDVEIVSHILDFDGRRHVRIASSQDITERARAESELLESEERYRGLVEQEVAGIYIIQDGKFAYVNPRFVEIAGFDSKNRLIGEDVMLWVAAPDRDKVAEQMRRLLNGGTRSVAFDFGVMRPDGIMIQIGANASRAPYAGRPAIIGLMQDISEKKRAEENIQRYIGQLKTAFMSTVEVATALSEMRDPYTAGHERRVAEIAVALGAQLGLSEERREGLRVSGFLHDIGKITIPSEILSKPGKLSAIEYKMIQGHVQAGYDVLKKVEFPWPVAQITLQHHERIDGSGYPQGLKGEDILLEARILAVADVVEAMSSHRPYRPGLGVDAALEEIGRYRGTRYDPKVVDACLKLFRERGYQLQLDRGLE